MNVSNNINKNIKVEWFNIKILCQHGVREA